MVSVISHLVDSNNKSCKGDAIPFDKNTFICIEGDTDRINKFVYPICRQIATKFDSKSINDFIDAEFVPSVFIITPSTKEAQNLKSNFDNILEKFENSYSIILKTICLNFDDQIDKEKLKNKIIGITTPKQFLSLTNLKILNFDKIDFLAFYDLSSLLFFGHQKDIENICEIHNKKLIFVSNQNYEKCLKFVNKLKKNSEKLSILGEKILKKSENLDVEKLDKNITKNDLKHFFVKFANFSDKFLIIFCLFKLGLATGKALILAKDIFESYKIKIFLNKFSISCQVFNGNLPSDFSDFVYQNFCKGLTSFG
ncbi:putative ATP-dependent RNA helicase ddx56 [Bonamia ostreae]|uniref:ATP-dependent RNA helicase ddx56 n=1 Tax=Bonamia ostreae TaxID=126728 RepID=A0ABV2AKU9_9EUKA